MDTYKWSIMSAQEDKAQPPIIYSASEMAGIQRALCGPAVVENKQPKPFLEGHPSKGLVLLSEDKDDAAT